ncbi:MAG: exodeoxyribonuclease VII small subunit [Ruminococcaceae bacterium]|nr:exodeoxyribonuclease VII small subunit [Oscillospiraceae bacterium]
MEDKKTQATDVAQMKLEDAMHRLDEVVAALDGEAVELEQSLRLYEEGVRLVRICKEKLDDAERTIRILKMNTDGEITEEAFDAQ